MLALVFLELLFLELVLLVFRALLFFALVFRALLFFAPLFFAGTLPPALRACDSPIAIACLRLFTVLPERPLLSVPRLRSCIAFPTFFDAFLPYLAIEVSVLWSVTTAAASALTVPKGPGLAPCIVRFCRAGRVVLFHIPA